ncbi:hypothetical protein GCM10008018_29130 [Paenibacillus marchantiophytorum]|uniref:Uncharacterized protein n=1 Tax=Paenibacillus marchantiophytorum TaxID=1619310 RepID=A0ABQ1EQ08_9BACL|nr:hypothetical protein GCM10008018_29130 [Paenibacillus marchantiophytorum]
MVQEVLVAQALVMALVAQALVALDFMEALDLVQDMDQVGFHIMASMA